MFSILPKNEQKNFYPRILATMLEVFGSFFGRIENKISSFRDLLTFKPATHVTRVCKTRLHDWSIRVVIVRKTTRGRTAFVVNLKPMRSFEKYSPYLACPSLCTHCYFTKLKNGITLILPSSIARNS